ncbi:MAG: MTAP family purine nucleoside phosphorylase [Candidatus Margulisbacteria bacterium]|nr:MTAP family purine nucleoside phosphorylase [Candidatus Margulisiibacteriota bacterium]
MGERNKIAIIGGSGIETLDFSKEFRRHMVSTEYGDVPVAEGRVGGKEIVFLMRHGKEYVIPSLINFRANMTALKKLGVGRIITTAAVGAINKKYRPGDLALLTDFLDFTRGQRETFTRHSFIDMSEPYDPQLNQLILNTAKKLKLKLHPAAVYACAEGPRFETKAEIKMYGQLGADLVGMTQVPEVVLAVEAKIPYAAIAVVTNYAAGVSPKKIDPEHVIFVMKEKSRIISDLIFQVITA